jgi:hypothetical protein
MSLSASWVGGFRGLVRDNAEGTVIAARPFDRAAVASLISDYPVQAAGVALLALAMRHKDTLGVLC